MIYVSFNRENEHGRQPSPKGENKSMIPYVATTKLYHSVETEELFLDILSIQRIRDTRQI
jgi:hypothetical protein